MTTALHPPAANERVVLHNISWKTYECLLADYANSSAPRLTYDRGALEIMSPLPPHEKRNRVLNLLVEAFVEEWDLDFHNLGSTTFRREDLLRGFEPDSCFYIQNAHLLDPHAREIDLTRDPPPDLVIEIDITHPSLDKFPIYAALGVPEVWRDDGATVAILLLADGSYSETAESRAFPALTGAALTDFITSGITLRRREWLRAVREWARRHRPVSSAP